jgi:hypothetical protein
MYANLMPKSKPLFLVALDEKKGIQAEKSVLTL